MTRESMVAKRKTVKYIFGRISYLLGITGTVLRKHTLKDFRLATSILLCF